MYLYSFGGGKPWQIWQIIGGSPNFTILIFAMSHDMNKESKQAGIQQSFTCLTFALEVEATWNPKMNVIPSRLQRL